jgi:hypothetical protein
MSFFSFKFFGIGKTQEVFLARIKILLLAAILGSYITKAVRPLVPISQRQLDHNFRSDIYFIG